MCKVSGEIYGYELEDGQMEGIELSRSEGIEAGRSEIRRKITASLYQEGLPAENIAEVVGETAEKVRERLRKERR